MSYIITLGARYVARDYLDQYRCIDSLRPIYYDYGRAVCSDALTFETEAAAKRYAQLNGLEFACVRTYDSCRNCIVRDGL